MKKGYGGDERVLCPHTSLYTTLITQQQLAHKFPKRGTTTVEHVVDLSRHNAAELAGEGLPADTYPLVIRLESIGEEGQLAGHTLDEFVPGQEQKSWMQSQSTYAKIVKTDVWWWWWWCDVYSSVRYMLVRMVALVCTLFITSYNTG